MFIQRLFNVHSVFIQRLFNVHLTFIWCSFDIHLTFVWRLFDFHLTFIRLSFDVYSTFIRSYFLSVLTNWRKYIHDFIFLSGPTWLLLDCIIIVIICLSLSAWCGVVFYLPSNQRRSLTNVICCFLLIFVSCNEQLLCLKKESFSIF
jgi:hypothetical protein